MATIKPIHKRSFHLGHYLAIVGIALALILGAFVVDAAASIGVLTRSVGMEPAPSLGSPTSPFVSPSAAAAPAALATPIPDLVPAPVPPIAASPMPAPNGKVIVIVISDQRLTAYQGGHVIVTSFVATGRPELATPKGTFHVMAKYSPLKFVSPWPKGNPYWYPDEWVSYGMLFANDGFFLHDAPWRTHYGPGTNLTQGTHGCVNVPRAPMATLYDWATVGTTVVIR
jgi:hypothetical protein